jgi:hypothetical protein
MVCYASSTTPAFRSHPHPCLMCSCEWQCKCYAEGQRKHGAYSPSSCGSLPTCTMCQHDTCLLYMLAPLTWATGGSFHGGALSPHPSLYTQALGWVVAAGPVP